MDTNRIHPLQVATLLLFIIGGFFFHAGSEPPCDSRTSSTHDQPGAVYTWNAEESRWEWVWPCESNPNWADEVGYDFLEATGIPKNTANTIGFGFFILALYCGVRDEKWRQTQKNEEAEKLPESPTEETSPRSAEQVQQLYENLGLETTKDTDETPPEPEADKNWWED